MACPNATFQNATFGDSEVDLLKKIVENQVAQGVSGGGSSGSALAISDEGTQQTAAATSLNFTGAGVTASAAGAAVTVNIPGGVAEITPSEIGNRIFHFDANAIVGLVDNDPVSSWTDQSGNGFDAVQAVAANQPLYKTAQLNGKPSVRFDGVDDFMTYGVVAEVSTLDGFSIFIVARAIATSLTRTLIWMRTNRAMSLIWQFQSIGSGMYCGIRGGNTVRLDPRRKNNTQASVYACLKSQSLEDDHTNGFSMHVDGLPQSTFEDAAIGGADNTNYLASNNGVSDFYSGDWFEAVAFDKQLTGKQFRGLYQYFTNKYDI